MTGAVTLVEVGPRDGFQAIGPFIPTPRKQAFLKSLVEAGFRRIEIGSFVSAKALPQLADTPELLTACTQWRELTPQVLVPTETHGLRALEAGAGFLSFVLSVSEAHNRNNVRRSPTESAAEYRGLCEALGAARDIRINLATAFDCPFEGRTPEAALDQMVAEVVAARPEAEICLCDTTGKAVPDQVKSAFERLSARHPQVKRWAYHAHDTYGLGLATVYAAWTAGVRVFDASFAGLGGCPYAPGATGNVATEDLVWKFERMGVSTGIDLAALLEIAHEGAALPGGQSGGRARQALGNSLQCGGLAQPG